MYHIYGVDIINRSCLCGNNLGENTDFCNPAIKEMSIKFRRFKIEELFLMRPLGIEDMDRTPAYELDKAQYDDVIGIIQYRAPMFVITGEQIKQQIIIQRGTKFRIVGDLFRDATPGKNLPYIPNAKIGDFLAEQKVFNERFGLPVQQD